MLQQEAASFSTPSMTNRLPYASVTFHHRCSPRFKSPVTRPDGRSPGKIKKIKSRHGSLSQIGLSFARSILEFYDFAEMGLFQDSVSRRIRLRVGFGTHGGAG